jgi:hypothetical protein
MARNGDVAAMLLDEFLHRSSTELAFVGSTLLKVQTLAPGLPLQLFFPR